MHQIRPRLKYSSPLKTDPLSSGPLSPFLSSNFIIPPLLLQPSSAQRPGQCCTAICFAVTHVEKSRFFIKMLLSDVVVRIALCYYQTQVI